MNDAVPHRLYFHGDHLHVGHRVAGDYGRAPNAAVDGGRIDTFSAHRGSVLPAAKLYLANVHTSCSIHFRTSGVRYCEPPTAAATQHQRTCVSQPVAGNGATADPDGRLQ